MAVYQLQMKNFDKTAFCLHINVWKARVFFCRLAGAQKELDEVMAMLKEKQDRLAEVEGHIAKLLASYNTSVAEKQLLEDNIAQV